MAAGNNGNGAGTPEDDDPFGYLYADGQAAGAQAPQGGGYGYPGPAAQPGVPRRSYNQVRAVGERQYGQVPQQQYAQPSPQYAAPETYPGADRARPAPPAQPPRGGGRGGGPNTKGLLIGALAVVAVVVTGITVAVLTNTGSDDKKTNAGGQSPAPTAVKESPTPKPSDSADQPVELPKQDAATLQLGAPAMLAKDVKGAEGTDGAYVTGFNAVGASVTWKADVPEKGDYKLYVRYAIPAKDANATLTVNGKANSNPLGLKNFIHSTDPNLEKNWQTTWAPVTLQKGENELKISCEQGNQCDALLDWLEVRAD
ncbi:carbohydrate-binding protein [Streptomyces sp. WAC05374]|uniref:CBM35 domain-containing protein n=1 Tax=Streptomyces sp. WAC05374 TaxID=2487420 RepID=UPI000F892DEB|nr:CBM35 domain-containing protein [Streptomyces sp. WAC05374]RST12168.1 carbohydrate-binding protein [Streptomyces sp. WAC05374]TDF47294.1 carbohydrate-binding protein [Streptomyces sp. WAC05374]TDF57552.1 carbohydrate-binding protein [Streptomyces sp. WAC05374]TDF61657.1 carbohydrate-binding protein [Streptomyces sp. WAC05374]